MKTIIVPVSFSQNTEQLLESAVPLAKAFTSTVYLLHVVLPNEDSSYKDKKAMGQEFAEESQALNRLAQQMRDASIDTHALLVEGIAATVILEEAEKLNADLIILGSHGQRPLTQALVTDVTQDIIKQLHCPALLIPSLA
ncbi:MAG: universal stress protein [Amphritea sp.]